MLHLRSARDALVSKAMALVVGPQLRLSHRCVHVKGHGVEEPYSSFRTSISSRRK